MPMFGVKDSKDLTPLNPPRTQDLTPVDIEDMSPSTNENIVRGGHGLFSTLDDYAKFARMLLTGQGPGGELILSRKMLEMSKANRIPASQLPLKIGINPLLGYGWGLTGRVMIDVGQARSLTNAGEFGWAGAATTYFWVNPVEDMIGVFMTQYLGSILPLSDDMRSAAYQMLA
jgi:CubicO group peptidase (beta-lactamase class C family)